MTHEATRLAEEAKQALSEALSAAESSGHPLNHSRSRDADSARDECIAAIDALAALAQPAPTAEVALPAVSEEVERVAFEGHLRAAWKVPSSYLDWALKRDARGYYLDSRAADQWIAWLARAQSAAKGDEGAKS